jgi:hypothetical protein
MDRLKKGVMICLKEQGYFREKSFEFIILKKYNYWRVKNEN